VLQLQSYAAAISKNNIFGKKKADKSVEIAVTANCTNNGNRSTSKYIWWGLLTPALIWQQLGGAGASF
jgi:hypothetical protein